MSNNARIYWFTGNTGAGKTTYATQFIDWIHSEVGIPTVHLDGDVLRHEVFQDGDLSVAGRWTHNIRTARLAKVLSDQGNLVVVSLICPYKALQQQVKEITDCTVIRIIGGAPSTSKTPYHPWDAPDFILPEIVASRNVNWHRIFTYKPKGGIGYNE